MATLSITISVPALAVGETFRERHRLLPSGAWSSYVSRTNATFSVTGLVDGTYEFEFSLVQVDGTICPPLIKTFDVVDEPAYECPAFTVTQVLSPDRIRIAYTGGTGVPTCGYNVQYRKSGSTGAFANIHYATLPTSPFYITIPVTGNDLEVRIIADQCNGSGVCFEDIIAYPPKPLCTHLGSLSWEIVPIEGTFQNKKKFRITITSLSQSSIPTTSVTINAQQTNVISPAVFWNAAIPITGISPATFTITFTLEFNIIIGTVPAYYWTISFVDACGFNHFLKVQYP